MKAVIVRRGAVLLVRYEKGDRFSSTHYNFPGGKAREGESLRDAVRRKVALEVRAEVDVGRLLYVVEYVPDAWGNAFGPVQKVQFNFAATLVGGAEPSLPTDPDDGAAGIEWVPLDDLVTVPLLPRVQAHVVEALGEAVDGRDGFVDVW